jgi:hypothetical protein
LFNFLSTRIMSSWSTTDDTRQRRKQTNEVATNEMLYLSLMINCIISIKDMNIYSIVVSSVLG